MHKCTFLFMALANLTTATFQSEMLLHHNALRAEHGAAPLLWDPALEAQAQAWADRCVMEHSDVGGENLAASGAPQAAENICYRWGAAEREKHPWNNEFLYDTGHFTQMIWAGTQRIGCARTWCPEGVTGSCPGLMELAVCRYDPHGNVQGRHAENVFPLLRKEMDGLVVVPGVVEG